MAIKFKIVQIPNPRKAGEMIYHVRVVSKGTLGINDQMSTITYGTTYTEADVDGLLSLLQIILVRTLLSGHNAKVERIGTFSPAIKSPKGLDKSKIGYHNIEISGIHFRPSAELMKKLSEATFTLSKEKTKSKYTLEQRKDFILHYLAENYHITGKYYQMRMFVSKSKALQDLNQFIEEGLIIREGNGPTTFYRLK